MEQRATAIIRKCLILAYIVRWIEAERHNLGKISPVVLDQVHKNALAEIVYLKQIMKRNGMRVLDKESQPKLIWVKFKENNQVSEATYPKIVLMADVEAHMKLMLQDISSRYSPCFFM